MDADLTPGLGHRTDARGDGLGAKLIRNHFDAVVFDLFGTLIDAPDRSQLESVAHDVAGLLGVSTVAVEQAITTMWQPRHDGTLPTSESAATCLAQLCGLDGTARVREIAQIFSDHAVHRLEASPSVVQLLCALKATGLKIGLLSDAAAEIAESWATCELSALVDYALFSCRAALLKPAPELYTTMTLALGVAARRTLYCGDGGGDELRGAQLAGFTAVRVERRGGCSAWAYGYQPWPGPSITDVEALAASALGGGPLDA